MKDLIRAVVFALCAFTMALTPVWMVLIIGAFVPPSPTYRADNARATIAAATAAVASGTAESELATLEREASVAATAAAKGAGR